MGTILIVDDNLDLADNLGEILSLAGHACTLAPSVAAATDALARARCDVAVVDMALPDGTGLAVVRAAVAADPPVPVVVWTAYTEDARVHAAVAAGAVCHVGKPCCLDTLVPLLDRLADPDADPVAIAMTTPCLRAAAVASLVERTPWRPFAALAENRPLPPPCDRPVRAVLVEPDADRAALDRHPALADVRRIVLAGGPAAPGDVRSWADRLAVELAR